ncbi:unnamed protein product [Penicillium pancosmium]
MAQTEPQTIAKLLGAFPTTSLHASKSALIVIGAQKEYSDIGKLNVKNFEKTIGNIRRLVEFYHANGMPVLYTRQSALGNTLFTEGSKQAEFIDALQPGKADMVLGQITPDAFVVGFETHTYISATAMTASNQGYHVIVIKDGVSDRDLPGATGEEVTKVTLKGLEDLFETAQTSDLMSKAIRR